MQGWITTHWPHPDLNPDPIPWIIYFKKHKAVLPGVGDRVLFYGAKEFKIDGKLVTHCWRVDRFGSTKVPLRKGAGGIVGLATVVSGFEDATKDPVRFNFGDAPNSFRFKIRCTEPLKAAKRIIPFAEMLSILRLPPKMPAIAFGLRRVKDERLFDALLSAAGLF